MKKISGVDYTAPDGSTVSVRMDSDWVVTDTQGEHRFPSVPQWMGYIRNTYGWPLPAKSVD